MDFIEWDRFNRWATYIQYLGYVVIGYKIEPFMESIFFLDEEFDGDDEYVNEEDS